ncbi:4a-hydroxytetrahydrobiopterin dehydratase [Rufibacter quisquiliarum]|uniref:4a-hydroxytetrahydrobiopterin dehydratase n=1 Tax=Rufibacter quisquiliarum TaxID=1549639 RepID=A0A839GPX6_9BACT|nr:4a-hydroxytetrahydrobiopterin dehydratase [Rufibacter quisquiliarum]MBA9075891.1 4a-hydroxytetrahydrobiopterin dehydratase [Rufibacter quisquiliarum]
MWIEQENALTQSFIFKDFQQAFAFMTAVAAAAEELNHHPWWSNVYNRVEIKLTTHDAGNVVTQKDWELAKRIDEVAEKYINND